MFRFGYPQVKSRRFRFNHGPAMPPGSVPQPDPDASRPDLPDAAALSARRRKTRRLILARLLLLAISSAGVLGAAALWADGRGGLALRVAAGDLLMILFVLLLF